MTKKPSTPSQTKPGASKKPQDKSHGKKSQPKNTSPQKTKKKTKKNKVTPAPQPVAPEVPQVVFNLPIQPDQWEIETNKETQENWFVFYKDGQEITKIPFTEKTFSGIRLAIDSYFPRADTDATLWRIQKPVPDTDELHPDPVMSLYNGNQLLAVTVLPQKELKLLIKGLQRHVQRPTPLRDKLVNWWKSHKIARVFLIILLLPAATIVLNAVVWGLGLY